MHMSKIKGKKHVSAPKPGSAHRIVVTKQKGGFTTETHMLPKAGKAGDGMGYMPPEPEIHPTLAAVHDHMNNVFGPEEGSDTPVKAAARSDKSTKVAKVADTDADGE